MTKHNELYLPASILIASLLMAVAIVSAGSALSTSMNSLAGALQGIELKGGAVNAGTVTAPEPALEKIDLQKLLNEAPAQVKGNANASVAVYEFSDFECPFCAKFFGDALKPIQENYVNTNKVKFAYMDFPLSFHPNAMPGALAARCAGDQGKYWEMHDKIFETNLAQGDISAAGLKAMAKSLALNSASFDSCLDSKKFEAEVNSNFQTGAEAGITGTPGFIVVADESKKEDLVAAANAINSTYGRVLAEVVEDSGSTGKIAVRLGGALPFSVFDSVLSTAE
ncbi:MAG TPA: thioredoxin domain-containing protein [archaeon]|nr:thioredoxin domain-containing protein [archaeon]